MLYCFTFGCFLTHITLPNPPVRTETVMKLPIAIVTGDHSRASRIHSVVDPHNFQASTYDSVDSVIAADKRDSFVCVVLCVDSSELAESLHAQLAPQLACHQSIIVIGEVDVRTAVLLMERGTLTVFQESFDHTQLVDYLKTAESLRQERLAIRERMKELKLCRESLTERQLKILSLVEQGKSNREIAEIFDLSQRTIELERARLMDAFKSASVAQLVSKSTELRVLTDAWHPKGDQECDLQSEANGLSA